MKNAYDIIGDIHGHHLSLITLLEKLGYSKAGGVYRHTDRKVIFLGDLIDRGPGQSEVIEIVRSMIDAGTAHVVMGNHEFNAIAYATPDPNGDGYLRPHSDKNFKQHRVFLKAYPFGSPEHAEIIAWFGSIPLWFEQDGLRVIHACWDHQLIKKIQTAGKDGNRINSTLLADGSRRGTWQFEALETLLKGKEIPLPSGHSFRDKENTERHHIRVRWWDRAATTYRAAYMGPESARTHIPDDEIAGDHLVEYAHDAPPVLLGHYWFEGNPEPLAPNIGCLDYSVAKPGGKLVAYRWDGESSLDRSKFLWVDRVESD